MKIVALDKPALLKQQFGKRMLKVEVRHQDGEIEVCEIVLDRPETPADIHDLFQGEQVATVRHEEATLEDIFVYITGRGLA